jgi:tRNA(Ile)-lysidine synthase
MNSVPALLERVVQTIQRHRMITPGQHAGVAVSGGADSVCLLHLLASLAPAWDLRLTVLHLDHGWRGEESREDAEFVRALAASLGLPIEIRRASLADSRGNREQAARTARLEFFRDAMAVHGIARVALGHTRSDQAETVLFRFLRGSGTAGLAAIRPVTDAGIVRPLLEIGREEVRQFLRQGGFRWREDSTNASPRFARNRIRQALLPQLRAEWNPAIEATLAHTADWALAEEAWWDAEIDRLAAARLVEKDGRVLVSAAALRDLPLAAARRLVRRAIERVHGGLAGVDFAHSAAVLELAARRGGTGSFRAAGVRVCRSFDWLCFTAVTAKASGISGYRLPAEVPGVVPLPAQAVSLSLELVENRETSGTFDCVYNKEVDCLDWQRLSGPLEVRNWRPGDLYQPVGSATGKKLKALFQQARVPVWERPGWPVLADGDAIVWTRRFGPATRVAAGNGASLVLRIREIGNPDQAESVYSSRAGEVS